MKRLRSIISAPISIVVLFCFLVIIVFFVYDELIYPLWAIMISPHPAKIDLQVPHRAAIPSDYYDDLIWSEDGATISVYASNWILATDSVIVLDVQGNVVIETFKQPSNALDLEGPMIIALDSEESIWAECSLKNLLISGKQIDESLWELSLWQNNDRTQSFSFSPVYPSFSDGHQSPIFRAFSPTCTYFVLTMEGWRYREGNARDELWLLDIAANTLTPIVIGRWPLGGMWDYPVQSVRPDWSPDENELAFGDPTFGLEIYNIETKTRRWLASPKQKAWGPKWSPSGRWIAAEQWLAEYDSVMIISSDGKQVASTGKCDRIFRYEWSPINDQLAFLCQDREKDENSLWIWTVE
jgi:WD40 repeat protein